jgi:hypothetical protein
LVYLPAESTARGPITEAAQNLMAKHIKLSVKRILEKIRRKLQYALKNRAN